MIRHSTEERNGLDFLLWAENDFNYIDDDEYNYLLLVICLVINLNSPDLWGIKHQSLQKSNQI